MCTKYYYIQNVTIIRIFIVIYRVFIVIYKCSNMPKNITKKILNLITTKCKYIAIYLLL